MRTKLLFGLFLLVLLSLKSSLVQAKNSSATEADVVLIGGGIMSATLANLLHELNPELKIEVYERLPNLAFESSGTLNNAGTGHAALSELNYTPLKADGTIDISKAVQINEEFEISKQFWAYLARRGFLSQPEEFINSVPHMSWVHGKDNVEFLRKRFAALKKVSLFQEMQYSEDPMVLKEWMPVLMQDRAPGEVMAATRSLMGTDVDYGRLTTLLFEKLVQRGGAKAFVAHEVNDLKRSRNGGWSLQIKDLEKGGTRRVRAKFVFIGAGGGTLPLLQKSGIQEAKGYGGFPVGGDFLIYKGSDLSEQHSGKIYGQAAVGAPPMSVPHLDTRIVNGKKRLLFGPFAGATTRFLKAGSFWDLMASLRLNNTGAMVEAGMQNLNLVKYLVDQETQSHADRIQALREFVPNAKATDWELIHAGVRVQVVKHDSKQGNVLRFGTEVVSSADGTMTALLGASPGASTSVSAMLEVLRRGFANKMSSPEWQSRLGEMIPSYGRSLLKDEDLMHAVRTGTARALHLTSTHSCRGIFGSSIAQ